MPATVQIGPPLSLVSKGDRLPIRKVRVQFFVQMCFFFVFQLTHSRLYLNISDIFLVFVSASPENKIIAEVSLHMSSIRYHISSK